MHYSPDIPFHVAFLPYMAPGHMLPMIEIMRLFAMDRNIQLTIITTPNNATHFQSVIDCDTRSGKQVTIRIVPFPSDQTGLPKNWENISQCATPEITIKLFDAINLLQPHIESLLHEIKPDCIFSDALFPWTTYLAAELCVPRLTFTGSGFFNHSLSYAIKKIYSSNNREGNEKDLFIVSGLPNKVLLTESQLPDHVKTRTKTKFTDMFEKLEEAERRSFGMVVNSFHELEPGYAHYYMKSFGIKSWSIGPVSLYQKGKTERSETKQYNYLSWLDLKGENSVLYVCFGSLLRFSKAQIVEIANALEDSSCSFVWVVAKVLEKERGEEEWWLPKGFEEKMEKCGKGMVIKGWAPQVPILEHPSVGGFLTHCGWNSILEGVTAGVPMITWPLTADQFYNEKLVTQVHKFGVPVGNEEWKVWATEETPLIGRHKIKMAVSKVMNGGDEAEEMRSIVKKLSKSAQDCVKKGGSSYKDLETLIEDIKSYKRNVI